MMPTDASNGASKNGRPEGVAALRAAVAGALRAARNVSQPLVAPPDGRPHPQVQRLHPLEHPLPQRREIGVIVALGRLEKRLSGGTTVADGDAPAKAPNGDAPAKTSNGDASKKMPRNGHKVKLAAILKNGRKPAAPRQPAPLAPAEKERSHAHRLSSELRELEMAAQELLDEASREHHAHGEELQRLRVRCAHHEREAAIFRQAREATEAERRRLAAALEAAHNQLGDRQAAVAEAAKLASQLEALQAANQRAQAESRKLAAECAARQAALDAADGDSRALEWVNSGQKAHSDALAKQVCHLEAQIASLEARLADRQAAARELDDLKARSDEQRAVLTRLCREIGEAELTHGDIQDQCDLAHARLKHLNHRIAQAEEQPGFQPVLWPGARTPGAAPAPTVHRDLEAELVHHTAETSRLQLELNRISDELWGLRSRDGDGSHDRAEQLVCRESSLIEQLKQTRKTVSDLHFALTHQALHGNGNGGAPDAQMNAPGSGDPRSGPPGRDPV